MRTSFILGAATGFRSTSGLGILAISGRAPTGSMLAEEHVRRALTLAWIGEILVDKTPYPPARTNPLPLVGRALLGAASAAIAASWVGSPRLVAAVVGGAAAMGTAWLATSLRHSAQTRSVPDLIPALGEDLAVAGLAAEVRRSLRNPHLIVESQRSDDA